MPMRKEIDGSKYDIRVICTGATDSADAGYVEGVPIDAPDDSGGWSLVDLWVEHDTEQETLSKTKSVTRLVNPAYYQLWVKPKSTKKKRAKAAPVVAAEPKKKRGRPSKEKGDETPSDPIETKGTEVAGN